MATHELYLGGPANPNLSRAQFPSFPFNAANTALNAAVPAAHKGPSQFALTRVLDFSSDRQDALGQYVRENPLAAADVLNIALVPANCLLYGLAIEVEEPSDDVMTATFTLDDGTTFGAAVDCQVAGKRFVPCNGVAVVAAGAVDLSTAEWSPSVRMVKMTLTTMTSDAKGLRISVSPLVSQLKEGEH